MERSVYEETVKRWWDEKQKRRRYKASVSESTSTDPFIEPSSKVSYLFILSLVVIRHTADGGYASYGIIVRFLTLVGGREGGGGLKLSSYLLR